MSRAKVRSRLAVRYFDDRILLTDNAAWAYFRLPTVSYEFTTGEEREALATNITIAMAGIRMQDAEIHLRIAHRTYPAAEWALSLDQTSDATNYLGGIGDVLEQKGHRAMYITHLGELADVALYDNDRQLREVHFRQQDGQRDTYTVRLWEL